MITDLEIGPDGHLYVVEIASGKIYRILPKSVDEDISKFDQVSNI